MKKLKKIKKNRMRGPLGFIVLWIIYKNPSKGSEIATELEKRRGERPSPGTIYPLLKDLVKKGKLHVDQDLHYSVTKKGEQEVKKGCVHITQLFYDFDEIKSYVN